MRISLLTLFFSMVFLGGCAVGPDYEPPVTPTNNTFVGAVGGMSVDPVNLYWWKGFSDPLLDELVLNAVRDNLTLQAAVARVNQARAVRQQSLLNLFPTVTADADLTNQRFGNQGAFGGIGGGGQGGQPRRGFDVEVYDAGFDATWELDFFGRVRRGLEQSTGQSEAALADLEDAIRTLVSEVARNYFELRGYQAQVSVARQNASNQDQVVHVAKALFDGGQSTEFDVMRSKAQWYSTLAVVPTFEANAKAAMFRLAVLTGKQPHELVELLSQSAPFPTYSGSVHLGDPASLIQRRPDVRAAERRLAAATAGIGVAKGDFFPKVTFVGTVSVQARNFNDLLYDSGESWSFGPRITWAAFDLPRVFARVDAAEQVTKEAFAQYQETVLTALEDVEGALARFSAARQRRDLLAQSVDQSQKAVEIARTQYENGLVDLLPVLDAQRALFIAQEQLTTSETELLTTLVALYKALSGGWDGTLSAPKGEDVPELIPFQGSKDSQIMTPVSVQTSTTLEGPGVAAGQGS